MLFIFLHFQKIEEAMISEGEENEADSEDEVVKAATNPFGRPSKGIYRSVTLFVCHLIICIVSSGAYFLKDPLF